MGIGVSIRSIFFFGREIKSFRGIFFWRGCGCNSMVLMLLLLLVDDDDFADDEDGCFSFFGGE